MKRNRRLLLVLIIATMAVAAVLSVVYLNGRNSQSLLPPGCSKPADGFLVIASLRGYNDSVDHGAPLKSWPIIDVRKGSTVNITVCNVDPSQAHGFQITDYFDRNIESVAPHQVIHVSFVADHAGSFDIYCSVFCTIHLFMQNGQLVVT